MHAGGARECAPSRRRVCRQGPATAGIIGSGQRARAVGGPQVLEGGNSPKKKRPGPEASKAKQEEEKRRMVWFGLVWFGLGGQKDQAARRTAGLAAAVVDLTTVTAGVAATVAAAAAGVAAT